jgi:arylsulfatase A-like enzyme
MSEPRRLPFPVLGLLSGAGYGMSVAIVHLAMGIFLIMALGMAPLTWFAARTIPMELGLALIAGLLWSPLFLARWGRWAHPLAMAATWIGLERWCAIDPSKPQMWLAPPVVALVFLGLGALMWRWQRWLPILLAVLLPVLLLSIPVARQQLSGTVVAAETERGSPPANAPDVLFIVMDTVRAKSVSAYGYERETTPNFDQLAAEGVLFEQATASATWSLPAHAALFTGAFPSVNNAHSETRYLTDELPTLAGTMAELGWQTLCFTANPHVSDSFGLTRGFHWSDNAWITGASGRSFTFIYRLFDNLGFEGEDKGGGQVVDNLRAWMAERPADGPPAFVFVNFLEAHFPFHQLPDGFRDAYTDMSVREMRSVGQITTGVQFGRQLTDEEFEYVHQPVIDMYDGGVLYTDYLMGQVVEMWRERGTLDETILVILSDHGEFTGEHRSFGHHTPIYQEAQHVPFMLRYPSQIPAGTVVEEPISTVGTFATILDLLQYDAPETVQIGSLLPALGGRPAGQPVLGERFEEHMLASRFAPGTANGEGPLLWPRGRYRTYRQGDLKLAHYFVDGGTSVHLFDLAADPQELNDIAESDPERLAMMEGELALWASAKGLPPLGGDFELGEGVAPELDAAAEEQLRALGYME